MTKTLLAAASAVALLATAASAQDRGTQNYVQVHGGAFFATADGFETDIFDDFVDGQTGIPAVTETELDYSTGYAVGALYGYRVAPRFAVEGEFTYRSNDIDSVTVTLDGRETSASEGLEGSSLDVMTFMANGVFGMAPDAAVRPYIGAGVGYATVDADADFDGAFAYQVKAGADVPIGQAGAIGAEVAYLGAGDFEAEETIANVEVEYGGVSLLATYKFGF